jgi:hypothetical protein
MVSVRPDGGIPHRGRVVRGQHDRYVVLRRSFAAKLGGPLNDPIDQPIRLRNSIRVE